MMNWSFDVEQRTGKLTVEQGLTIVQVCQLQEVLLRGFAEADEVVLDIGAAADIDVAGLQLLCAAHRFAVGHGKQLLLAGVGERAREVARAAGFVRGAPCSPDRDTPCFWTIMA